MDILIDIILKAGRSAVELSLFVLLPVMVVMLSLMRLLEARNALDWLVARIAPLLKPFGLTGLGVFAALQINFVSFAAPIATLAMMEQRGTSDRHLAATLAMVFAMAQANAALPMMTMGLEFMPTLVFSVIGGLCAAAATYYVFGHRLSQRKGRSTRRCTTAAPKVPRAYWTSSTTPAPRRSRSRWAPFRCWCCRWSPSRR